MTKREHEAESIRLEVRRNSERLAVEMAAVCHNPFCLRQGHKRYNRRTGLWVLCKLAPRPVGDTTTLPGAGS